MIVLRREFVVESQDENTRDGSEAGSEEDKKKPEKHNENAVAIEIGKRISAVEVKLDATTAVLQETLDSLKDKATPWKPNDDYLSGSRALESRISVLEDKVDMMVTEMRNFFNSFPPPSPSVQ